MVRLLLGAGALLLLAPAHAEAGCAGDGEAGALPAGQAVAPSAIFAVRALPYAGRDLSLRAGDPGDAGAQVYAGTARLGLCGRLRLRRGELRYQFGYEPYDANEAARADAAPLGRLLAAELGYTVWRWLVISGGVRKLAFSYGHDEPEQALALPVRPTLSNALAPDRRLGLTVDTDWGPVRVIAGVYDSARTLRAIPEGGLLITARGVMEPFGPVGRSISTLRDEPFWRQRVRAGFNVSLLFDWNPRGDAPLGLAIGGDLPIKYGPLGLVVEYIYARSAPSEAPGVAPGQRADRQGVWAQAALMVLRPYLELEGRYEWFHGAPPPEAPSPGAGADARQRFHALSAGLTGFLYDNTLKLQAAYGRRFHDDGSQIQDDYLLVVMQLAE